MNPGAPSLRDAAGFGHGSVGAVLRGADCILRGVSQVMLQDNRYAGALFLAGLFWNAWLFGCAALAGTIASTVTAAWAGYDRQRIASGLYGFNGALVGIALLYFLRPDALTWICVIFAAAGSTVLAGALETLLRRSRLPAFTAPFVFVSWGVFLAAARFGRLHSTDLLPQAGLPQGTAVEGTVTVATLASSVLQGVAEVFFQGNLVTGALFVAGLLVASWRAATAAVLGAFTGALVAWALGAAEPAIRAGAFGFNGVLVAIALASILGTCTWRAVAALALALLATPFAYAACTAALQPFGLPTLTFPFVVVTWIWLQAARGARRRAAAA